MEELELILQAELAKKQVEENKKKAIEQIRKEKMTQFIDETLNKMAFLKNYDLTPYKRDYPKDSIFLRYKQGAELKITAFFKENGEISHKFHLDWNCNGCHSYYYETIEETIKMLADYIKL